MSAVSRWMPKLRSIGPYLLIELLLPGGTLIALLLWLSQGMTRSSLMSVDQPVVSPHQIEKLITPEDGRVASDANARS
jgi:hypothetical protein